MKSLGIITCDDTYHYWGDIMISYEQEWQLHQSHKIPAFEGGSVSRVEDKGITIEK